MFHFTIISIIIIVFTVEIPLQIFAIKWLALQHIPQTAWKTAANCPRSREYRKFLGVSASQAKICRKNFELMPLIVDASQSTVEACQKAFAGHRWNCSSINSTPTLTPDLTKGTKEQAFVYALAAAALSQRIAKACVSGKLPNCPCGYGDTLAKTTLINSNANSDFAESYKWKGCSDNIVYGKRVSREWTESSAPARKHTQANSASFYDLNSTLILNASENNEYSMQKRFAAIKRRNILTKDITAVLTDDKIQKYFMDSEPNNFKSTVFGPKSKMNQHNNDVGREVTEQSLYRKCKCHGVSSSCDVKTCWYTLPPLEHIAERLKQRYITAQMIGNRNEQFEIQPKVDVRMLRNLRTKHSLVYLNRSPDYCEENISLGSHGTKMRECNLTSTGPDSCESLCCGRGFNTQLSRVEEQCHCKYVHCCYVKCKTCVYEFDKHYCK